MTMRLQDFDFELPSELIAQTPISPRDRARLLVAAQELQDRFVYELPKLLMPGDILVFNDTKVIPARLRGTIADKSLEVTLHKPLDTPGTWLAFAKPAKRAAVGEWLSFATDFSAEILARGEGGEVRLAFDRTGEALFQALGAHGVMPLPPYIKRAKTGSPDDARDYQTIYAREEGAVAAPTAGLHFTPELMQGLDARGIETAFLTLHVGAGTFLPIRSERIEEHKMHSEYGIISSESAEAINRARKAGGRVVAVGTTSLRLLETAADKTGTLKPFSGWCDIFITPGYRFKLVDRLLTNFHLPRSTLFLLVSAFSGTARMQEVYCHAIAEGYRFYSYGDASLLERA